MATFDAYNSIIEEKIANTSEIFFDEGMKKSEINNAMREITSEYNLPELKKKATITFDASGIAAKPAGYKEMIKLWTENAGGTQLNEWQYTPEDVFDRFGSSASYMWTEDYDTSDDTRKIFVKPIDSGTLNIRFYKLVDDLTSSNDESGLASVWNETVALGATERLLKNAGRYEEAQVFQQEYRDKRSDTFLRVKNEGGIKRNNRIKSKFERVSQLGVSGSSLYYNSN